MPGLSWVWQALVNQIQFLKLCAFGEVAIDIAEYGERVLASGDDYVAQAVLRIATCEDSRKLWERFESSLVRVYGAEWRHWDALNESRPLVCKHVGCMELALNGICDQCVGLGRS